MASTTCKHVVSTTWPIGTWHAWPFASSEWCTLRGSAGRQNGLVCVFHAARNKPRCAIYVWSLVLIICGIDMILGK